jgi:hypothetical protein
MATTVTQVFKNRESIGDFTQLSPTTYQLGLSVITIGALQYTTDAVKSLDTQTLGLGGIDALYSAGAKVYKVFAVAVSGEVHLIAGTGDSPNNAVFYGITAYQDLGFRIQLDDTATADNTLLEQELPKNKVLKNRVINGGMDFWQRNITFTSGDNYTADRFLAGDNAGSAAYSVDRVEDVPADSPSTYSMKCEVTASTTLAAGDTLRIQHSIEGSFFKDLYQDKVRFDFWVKTNRPGRYTFGLVTDISTTQRKAYGAEYIINSTDWEKKSIIIDFSSINTDNIFLDNQKAFDIVWGLSGGSSRVFPSLGNWIDASILYSQGANAIDWQDTLGSTFQLTDVMCYEADYGEKDFERAGKSHAEELQLCQRYYCKSYNLDTSVPTNTGISQGHVQSSATGGSSNDLVFHTNFPVEMRAVPNFTSYSMSGIFNRFSNSTTDNSGFTVIYSGIGTTGAAWHNATTSIIDSNWYNAHWSADAEL